MGWKKHKKQTLRNRSTLIREVQIEKSQEERCYGKSVEYRKYKVFESPVRGEILIANSIDKEKESRGCDIDQEL